MNGYTPAPRREIFLLCLIVLAGAFLRFIRLDAQSLWIDEYLMIQRASLGEPFRWSDWFVNPQGPLPALILRLWTGAAGTAEAALRLPSAVFGTLTIPFVYLLARRMCPAAGLPAASLAAFSPFLVWYSQETRHYALAFLAAAAAGWAILRLEKLAHPRKRDYLAVAGSLLAGLMSNLTMTFTALAQILALLTSGRRNLARGWFLAAVPVGLAMLPWFWVTVTHNLNLDHVVQAGPIPEEELLRGESTFSWLGLPYTGWVFFAGYSLGPPLSDLHAAPRIATVLPHLPVILPLAVGVLVLLVAGWTKLRRDRFQHHLVLYTLLFSTLFVVLLSIRNAKVFNPRYLGVALPLLLGVAGLGWTRLLEARRWIAILVGLLVAVPTGASLINYYRGGVYAREDIRSAATVLTTSAAGDDIILGQGAPQVLHWYYRGPAPVVTVYDVWVRNLPDLERRVDEWSRERRRVWLLISRPWLQDPEFRLRSVLERRFGPGEVRSFDGVTLVSYNVRQESSR